VEDSGRAEIDELDDIVGSHDAIFKFEIAVR
jgi:hypothetical protein